MKTINSVDTKEFLNHQVANLNVFTVKIHQIHWYMRGHNFFTLHEKMDDLYSELANKWMSSRTFTSNRRKPILDFKRVFRKCERRRSALYKTKNNGSINGRLSWNIRIT